MVDSLGIELLLKKYGSMLQEALKEEAPAIKYKNVQRVVICGMGGSGVVGEFVASVSPRVHIHTVKSYDLPEWVGSEDLVICISYSGNTEETLSCFNVAMQKKCLGLVVTSGGELMERAQEAGVAVARIPSGFPPRFSTVSMLIPVLKVLKELGISEVIDEVPDTVLVDEIFCEHIAHSLLGKIPLVYASQKNYVLAEKLKTDINENAKTPAFFNVFPEQNHNELLSYEHITPTYVAVFWADSDDHERVKKRMLLVKNILVEKGVVVLDIPLPRGFSIKKLLHGNYMCLLISYYLSQEYGVDPGPVELIESFKGLLRQD